MIHRIFAGWTSNETSGLPGGMRAGLSPFVAGVLALLALVGRCAGNEDFSRTVRPLLASRCGACHGGDQREGGLSLASRDSALAKLDSGRLAIVPGRPDESELVRRIESHTDDERMPPKGEPLSADERQSIRRWIAAGAPWDIPWAYRPLVRAQRPPLDRARLERIATPSDWWLEARLAEQDLTPRPLADRVAQARRLFFDLVGLPPLPEQLEEFLADSNPDAWQRLVDRTLASPRLGERWARHWMDVAHFAETHGHDQDRPRRNAWPYRDYLIRAFNSDRSFSRFVMEQIAGDALDPLDPDAQVATGFLAAGPWDESSLRDIRDDTLDRQIARYLDRDDIVSTAIGAFASTTIHCARCHDHKFDPISQVDYYRLQAVFASTDKAERTYDPDAAIARRRHELRTSLAALNQRRSSEDSALLAEPLTSEVAAWERRVAAQRNAWTIATPTDVRSEQGSQLTIQADGSVLSGGTRPERDTYTIQTRVKLPRIAAVKLEVLPDSSLPHRGPGRQDNGNLHLSEFELSAARDSANGQDSKPPQRVALRNPRADFDQQGWTIAHALDGNLSTAWGVYPEVGKPHQAVFELAEPLEAAEGVTLLFTLKQLHGGGHLIGRPRLSVTEAAAEARVDSATLPAAIAQSLARPATQRSAAERLDLAVFYLRTKFEAELAALPSPQLVYAGTSRFEPDGSFKPAEKPRPIHVLRRGDVREPGAEVGPGALRCLPHLSSELSIADPSDESQRRLGLARWLADPANGLTWRSIANRWWHYHFGRGIVDTPNDFGMMGGAPTHPELLDELALELQRHDGSLKWLHRELVTSAAYRRASTHDPRAASIDADNRLLWRMNRSRLDAESVRDALLCLSGTLDYRMGGPSDQQFILSPGVHVTPVVDYAKFDAGDRANYRRSIYRFLFRTLPDPFFEALDCADASQWTPARNVSMTALQALALLNDKFVLRQCEHLAETLESDSDDPSRQTSRLFQLLLLREPTDGERRAFRTYIERHGLENACRWLVNSNEFAFVD